MNGGDIKGILYLVATPIGNLKDITLRALEVLKTVDVIAAEDTRKTRILLNHYQIFSRPESFHKFNEASKKNKLLEQLSEGHSVAVVSDAGTPGISDPAYSLVREALKMGITVTSLPGANSVISALIISGLPTENFYFGGFPPRKQGPRNRFFEDLKNRPETLIFFESPHRLMKTLEAMLTAFGDRNCAICRELTKKFEDVVRGPLSSILAEPENLIIRGEFVLVIEGYRGK